MHGLLTNDPNANDFTFTPYTDENGMARARRDSKIANRPAGTTVCKRCKGYGSREGWAYTGSTCHRCSGAGYCLNADQLVSMCRDRAVAHLEEVVEQGKACAATAAARNAAGRESKHLARRLDGLRNNWRRISNVIKALDALAGTDPTITAVRKATKGTHYGATCS